MDHLLSLDTQERVFFHIDQAAGTLSKGLNPDDFRATQGLCVNPYAREVIEWAGLTNQLIDYGCERRISPRTIVEHPGILALLYTSLNNNKRELDLLLAERAVHAARVADLVGTIVAA